MINIHSYNDFINESKHDLDIIDLFSSLTRNYESVKSFHTDYMQFIIDEERRDWGDISSKVELAKTKKELAEYKIVFTQDKKKYLIKLNYSFEYTGKTEKDSPGNATEQEFTRLGIVLESINVTKIEIISNELNIDTRKITDAMKRVVDKFIIKMMEIDYDTLGKGLITLEHQ